MLAKPTRQRRRGASAVECAFVLPLTFLLIIGLIVGALGVFRSQETAELARLAARYASVHGGKYTLEGYGTVSKQQIIDAAITPRATNLSPMTVNIEIILPDGAVFDWDDSYWTNHHRTFTLTTQNGQLRYNRARVTVTYDWVPEGYLIGPIRLTSTSEMPMSY